ncbi:hypothetical protein HF675_04005 [Serratia sp. JUb9]|nr:hypothetical protein HF675_04005 [Serratia sp. JUb9]
MNETRQYHAYQRGMRIASLWKRIKGTILRWDAFCVAKAHDHKLPSWVGRTPLIFISLCMLVALALGGIIFLLIALFITAISLLVLSIFSPPPTHRDDAFEYKAFGDLGPGWYSGKTKVSSGDSSPYNYRGNSDG